jgi:hypothetical protein
VLGVSAFLDRLGVDRSAFLVDSFRELDRVGAIGSGDYATWRFSRVFRSRRWWGVFDGCSDMGDIVAECERVLGLAAVRGGVAL